MHAVGVTRSYTPGNHGYAEPGKGAYTQASDRTDQDLYDAGKGKTYTGVHGIHPPHGVIEVHEECEIRNVREHR